MKVDICLETNIPGNDVRVGNVYQVRGGRGASQGHMNILIAITEPQPCNGRTCLFLTVNREGEPVSVTRYGLHYVEDLQPIAFVDGLDDMLLTMRSL